MSAGQLALDLAPTGPGCIGAFRAGHGPATATHIVTEPPGVDRPVCGTCLPRWVAHAAHPMRPYRIEVTPIRSTAAPTGGPSTCLPGA